MKTLTLLLLIAPATLGCTGLAPAVKNPRSPEAWRSYWLAQHADDMKQPAPDPDPPHPVGHGQTVLLYPGMTIGKEMFDSMAERLRRDGFTPVLYEDPELLTDGVVPSAKRLAAEIERVAAASGQERIDVVAQCVGGVVSRYYLELLGGDKRIAHLVTFVSPHHGSAPARIADPVVDWQGMRDIRRDSAVLARVDREPVPATVRFTSIYSCHDDLILPHDTAVVAGAHNVELCAYPVDHFSPFWDPVVYRHVIDGLTAAP
ncbi:MAG: hypothetical protein JST54_20705 [Deltaproteobacteria bacterium]|nr:hypothetical protein [Deltaproteobacteria bacterium]